MVSWGVRLLGIDYGSKRVGLALSDEGGRLAVPYGVWPRTDDLVSKIIKLCEKEGVERVVIGESRDFSGRPNPLMIQIEGFKRSLERERILTAWEPEFLTSAEALRPPQGGEGWWGDRSSLDARAAALILKSYIDRQDNLR